ncbi:hypothetical protein AALO_G00196220 [Alosa alosa]|uniref:Integrase core domain-containing protein n=1 Tax=Alosa alosa TaxID=278164 RepID=A0AAV6G6K1_9TELE|nr:hypothetical protein AALO_G00196220 [Alosa alosa]
MCGQLSLATTMKCYIQWKKRGWSTYQMRCTSFVYIVILPRLRSDLKCFSSGWDKHPLRTEGNLSPDQLWHIGMLQTPVVEPDVEPTEPIPDCTGDLEDGVVVTEIPCPLSDTNFAVLEETINPLHSTLCHTDLYIQTFDLVQRLN